MASNKYAVDYANRAVGCKNCKVKIEKNQLRIIKIVTNTLDVEGEKKTYYHPMCIFDILKRSRGNTKKIKSLDDLECWEMLEKDDIGSIKNLIVEFNSTDSLKKRKISNDGSIPKKMKLDESISKKITIDKQPGQPNTRIGNDRHPDNSFKEFSRICADISAMSGSLAKTDVVRTLFNDGFSGDVYVWVRLLLPGVVKRVYNLQSKQLIKLFARIFNAIEGVMLTDLENGDLAQTIATFYAKSELTIPEESSLSIFTVDDYLENLKNMTTEDEQRGELTKIIGKCTVNDLKMFIRLIKGDLRIQAGAKVILDALHPQANEAFNSFRNIDAVLDKILELKKSGVVNGSLDIGISLMQPIQPMLAKPCKSVDEVFERCPNGIYSEIKYDGERVQLHKNGGEFKYFSRSLKPVAQHKIKHFDEFITRAFPDGSDLILDAEVLMVDVKTGAPLPFGSLGVHKAAGFEDAVPCLFVFDCIYYNGENLLNKPIRDRRTLLTQHMVEVKNVIKLSEMKIITQKSELTEMINDVLNLGLEGLVLKDVLSVYEPGKRRWLKIKKDYLNNGAMADSADLVVLGGWYGTGSKGGIISIFLMGCRDEENDKWRTVTKVHTGHDDATLEVLQSQLGPNMNKIKRDYNSIPTWLDCARILTPDFVVEDPKQSQVWEITGAEFSKSDIHSANKTSIRFPRVTRIRNDKNWETATTLKELCKLAKTSRESANIKLDYVK